MSPITRSRTQQRTYTDFLSAGLELLIERGYDAVRVSDIVRRADYGRSTFYLYFRDKEDFAWSLLRYQMDQIDAHVEAQLRDLPPEKRLYASWQILFTLIEGQRAFFLSLEGELSRRLRQWQRDWLIERVEAQLREGFYILPVDAPPEFAARMVVATVLEVLEYWLLNPQIGDTKTIVNTVYALIVRDDPPD